MPLNRRHFLISLGSVGTLAACGGGGGTAIPNVSPSPSFGSSQSFANGMLVLDLTKTDLLRGTDVYLYVVGNISNTWYWYNGSDFLKMVPSDNRYSSTSYPPSMKSVAIYKDKLMLNYNTKAGWADYSVPLIVGTKSGVDLKKILLIPGLSTGTSAFSGRIFVSVGPLKLPITWAPGGPTFPTELEGPGMFCLYDWCEFSIDSTGTLYLNTTQVNQFGFQLIADVTPRVSPSPVGLLSGTREGLMTQLSLSMSNKFGSNTLSVGTGGGYTYATSVFAMAVPTFAPEGKLYPTGVDHLRAVAPNGFNTAISGYTPRSAITSYFDNYIRECYASWQSRPLVTKDQTYGYYSGFVPTSGSASGMLIFYPGNLTISQLRSMYDSNNGSWTYKIPVIPTNDVWLCANALATGDTENKNIEKMIAAAFNRGTVSFTMDDSLTTVGGAYGGIVPNPAAKNPVWNPWAESWHKFNTDALAYGFAYDDVNDQSTTVKDLAFLFRSTATIVLGTFFTSHLRSIT